MALGVRENIDEADGKDDGEDNISEGKQKKPQEVSKRGGLSVVPGTAPLTEAVKGKPE